MRDETDEMFFARRAQEELDRAAAATDAAVKAIHLDLASRYSAERERAARGERYEPKFAGNT
ncbi:MAG: hypothetical protein WBL20_02160 [Sphingobium sp.]|uniref:hypothetical protein n=1 Tax=uncultured Sphingomonas sp. TaxID=158754 RepID=UPI0025912F20|nr:hypothetical protein [uncultured Sphingomonas sp.]